MSHGCLFERPVGLGVSAFRNRLGGCREIRRVKNGGLLGGGQRGGMVLLRADAPGSAGRGLRGPGR